MIWGMKTTQLARTIILYLNLFFNCIFLAIRYGQKILLDLSESPLSHQRPYLPFIPGITCEDHSELILCSNQKAASRQIQKIIVNNLFAQRGKGNLDFCFIQFT